MFLISRVGRGERHPGSGIALVVFLLALPARAQSDITRAALERAEEVIAMRSDEGVLRTKDTLPIIVVSTAPHYEESRAWYPTEALATLTRIFGAGTLRFCEACMAPRTFVTEQRVEQHVGPLSADEIARLDETVRGAAQAARSALWLDETATGVAVRIVDLNTGRIALAENIDPGMTESTRTTKNVSLVRELDRRARGDAITQVFVDVVLYPGQHVSLDWTEQWGDTNSNLSGISLSIFDPIFGVGGVYYRVIPEAWNLMLGTQVFVSLPTALARGISGQDIDVLDPILTAALLLRIPFGSSNYGLVASLSTNGRAGIGISMMNISLLPVLP